MTKFKIGDKLKLNSNNSQKREVVDVRPDGYVKVKNINNDHIYHDWCYPSQYTLELEPKEEAINLLTSLGYTITEPKPKLTGKVSVWAIPDDPEALFYSKKTPEETATWINPRFKLVAIVDWTEGEGI